jgi:hypothetical protein
VQLAIQLSDDIGGAGEDEVIDLAPILQAKQLLGDVLDVLLPVVVDVALQAHLRRPSPIVAVGHVVGHLAHLLDPPEVREEQSRMLMIHERRAGCRIGLENRFQLEHVRRGADVDVIPHRPRDLDVLPSPGR